jgi:myo-inositol-1-phosphate synthase
MSEIRVGLVGIGNCSGSLVQGIAHYAKTESRTGLINEFIGPYAVTDINVVLGIDVDQRKVGLDIAQAIFAAPNNMLVFEGDVPHAGVPVLMGKVLDGVATHMTTAGERGFKIADAPEATQASIVAALKAAKVDVLVNFLPVGSQAASAFYMECALEAGVAVVNCIPVFIASNAQWADRFRDRGLPIVGDDIKAQVGATIVHRMLSDLFASRGATIDRTYQLNTGGNTDFMNMLDRGRLTDKKESKTEAVQAALAQRLDDENILIGPSEYVPWQKDNKICFLRIEGTNWGGAPLNLELRLSVEDSPNSAACVLDAIRCCKVAMDRGEGGVLAIPSAYYCKHPPVQMDDNTAGRLMDAFARSGAHAADGHQVGDRHAAHHADAL